MLLAACGGGGSSSTPTAARPSPAPSRAAATTRAAPSTTGQSTEPAAGNDEVTGIVGVVINNASTQAISIQRLSGAPVTKIDVGPTTKIRRATGGSMSLSEVHSSDRIIARGALNDRQDALLATEITVQDVVPGAAPGG